jgi:hypothetical protein
LVECYDLTAVNSIDCAGDFKCGNLTCTQVSCESVVCDSLTIGVTTINGNQLARLLALIN